MGWIRRKIQQIKNVFRWLPIIWKQRDYDYSYAIEVFKFQLSKTADFMDSDKANGLNSKQDAKRIRNILKFMDKVYSEEYAMEYQDAIKEMYGDDVIDFEIKPVKEGSGLHTLKFKYESWDNAEEINRIKSELFLMSQEKQKRAHKLLWKLIEHNIQGWWD